ncbi:MAG: hypothetical protein ACKVZJ_12900 [Phycisphaerales bacterium]
MPRHPLAPFLAVLCFTAFAALPMTGCASSPAPAPMLRVEADAYPAAFEAAKDVLREYAFELDRVDATAGVLTTHTRGSAGFATPWIPHSSSFGDAGRGFLDRERRRAMVVFEPVDSDQPVESTPEQAAASVDSPVADSKNMHGEDRADPLPPGVSLHAKVMVVVERVYRPGRRVGSTSVRLASFASDPELKEQGLEPAFSREVREDPGLEARMARAIASRLAGAK